MGKHHLHSKPNQEESPSPFIIIKDYRKTIKLKKQRELRKKRNSQEREIIKGLLKEEKKQITDQINRSMLEEDDVWSRVQEEVQV